MRTLLLALTLLAVPARQDSVPELLRKLGSADVEEQGRARRALEAMGSIVAPELRDLAEKGSGGARDQAQKILARFQEVELEIRRLAIRLGSADDEEKEAAESELRRLGIKAVPFLREAAASDQKNLKRRAERLLAELAPGRDENPLLRSRVTLRRAHLTRGGGGKDTEDAVLAALTWLARHQSPDGSWKVTDYEKQCAKVPGSEACRPAPGELDYDNGVTALALLAFLGSGYTHLSTETHAGISFGDVVRKGLQRLLSLQAKDGCVGERGLKYMYPHALATAALAEALALTGTETFKNPAQQALGFLADGQNRGKGWRYSLRCGDNDTSVTGWAVLAFRAAEAASLPFPKSVYEGAVAWFDEATDPVNHRTGYNARNTGRVFVPGKNETFEHNEAMSAMMVHARIAAARNKSAPGLAEAVAAILKDKPSWAADKIDFYYWHLGTQAIFNQKGPDSAEWRVWNSALKDALLRNQNTAASGCRNGSWEPVDRWSGEGGRVYATALNALTLEVYYLNVRTFGDQ